MRPTRSRSVTFVSRSLSRVSASLTAGQRIQACAQLVEGILEAVESLFDGGKSVRAALRGRSCDRFLRSVAAEELCVPILLLARGALEADSELATGQPVERLYDVRERLEPVQ